LKHENDCFFTAKYNEKEENTMNIGVLVSGGGTNLQELIDAVGDGRINGGKIVCVGSDNPKAFGLERAANAGIPVFHLDYAWAKMMEQEGKLIVPGDLDSKYTDVEMGSVISIEEARYARIRSIVEWGLLNEMKRYGVDLLVGAGFNRVLTDYFHDRCHPDPLKPRVINIHPAILDAFPGTHAYKRAYNRGVKVHGISVHFMDKGVDTGPIIMQRSYDVNPEWTFEQFNDAGLVLEYDTLWRCVQFFIERRLKVKPGPDGKQLIVDILDKKRFHPR
jgi:phosphoribosylglycinamide formyltransferase-1